MIKHWAYGLGGIDDGFVGAKVRPARLTWLSPGQEHARGGFRTTQIPAPPPCLMQYKRAPGFAAHPCVDDRPSKGQADG